MVFLVPYLVQDWVVRRQAMPKLSARRAREQRFEPTPAEARATHLGGEVVQRRFCESQMWIRHVPGHPDELRRLQYDANMKQARAHRARAQ